MQTHATFKNYKCRKCDKSFALKSYLHKHYESGCYKDQDLSQSSQVEARVRRLEERITDILYFQEKPNHSSSHIIHMPTPVFPYLV